MRLVNLIFKEIRYRKVNFLLSLFAVVVAVALFVTFLTAGDAYRRDTRRIQLGLGQNLRIIPRQTPMDKFLTAGFSELTMPEEYVHRFAALDNYEYTHLTGMLQKRVTWQGRDVILTGILPEVMPPGRNQPPMTFSVERGDAYVGSAVAELFSMKAGEQIDVLSQTFRVARILSPSGDSDDIRIYGHLHDVQAALGLEGQINEIRALECLCLFESAQTDLDPLTLAKQQLAEILPEGRVLLVEGIAQVRQKQRAAMEGYLALLMPIVLAACGAWVGLLAMMNVRQRYQEIGILRALGYVSEQISVLLLGRSAVIGLAGAVVGFAAGTALALHFGPEIFQTAAGTVRPDYGWLYRLMILAPAFAAVSSLIPTVLAATWDPAKGLRSD